MHTVQRINTNSNMYEFYMEIQFCSCWTLPHRTGIFMLRDFNDTIMEYQHTVWIAAACSEIKFIQKLHKVQSFHRE